MIKNVKTKLKSVIFELEYGKNQPIEIELKERFLITKNEPHNFIGNDYKEYFEKICKNQRHIFGKAMINDIEYIIYDLKEIFKRTKFIDNTEILSEFTFI
jgi:hypothetical protein